MRRLLVVCGIISSVFFGVGLARTVVAAQSLGQKLSGRILIQVQSGGAVWYVSPVNFQRYNLGNTTTAPDIIKKLSLAMSQTNMDSIPVVGSSEVGNLALRRRLSGRIIRIASTTEHWYISPLNLQRYRLDGNPFVVLKKLSLGVNDANLKLIPIAAGFSGPTAPVKPVNGLLRTQKTVVTSRGTYSVEVMTLDTATSTLKIMTDTGNAGDCKTGCTTLPLKTYVDRRAAVAGMHATYFCPYDYASCIGQTGFYFYPVFNSFSKVMINEVRMKYTTQPIVAIDTSNKLFYYAPTLQFHSLAELKTQFTIDSLAAGGTGILRAALSSSPIMVLAGKNVLNTKFLDTKQATVKSFRGALGWKGSTVYFFIVRGATVTDSAAVAAAMGLDVALNLDGGGSTALYQNGSYAIGPGRNLPNALLLVK